MRCGQNKRRKKAVKIYGIWALLVILINLAAWLVPGLCDWYIRYIFTMWINSYGRLMDFFPFSVGELMLAAGVGLVVIALLLGLILLIGTMIRALQNCR